MSKINVAFIVQCIECGKPRHVPFAMLNQNALPAHLAADGWFLSVVTPPGEPNVVMAALCGDCAPEVHPPGVLSAAEDVLGRNRS